MCLDSGRAGWGSTDGTLGGHPGDKEAQRGHPNADGVQGKECNDESH